MSERLIPVAARLLRLRVRIPPEHGCLSLVSVVCYQVEVSVTGLSLVLRSPFECGVSEAGITRGYSTHYSPASSVVSGRAESKLAMPLTRRNKKARQSASSTLVHHLTSHR